MQNPNDFLRLLDGALTCSAADGRAIIRIPFGRSFPVRSAAFRAYLNSRAISRLGITPSHRTFSHICRHLEGDAVRNEYSLNIEVNRRLAPRYSTGAIHIDLANPTSGDFIQISPTSWTTVREPAIEDSLPFESSP